MCLGKFWKADFVALMGNEEERKLINVWLT